MNAADIDARLAEIDAMAPRQAVSECAAELRAIKKRIDSLRTSIAVAIRQEDPARNTKYRAELRDRFAAQTRFQTALHHHQRLRDKQELHEAWCLVVQARYGALIAAECCAEAVRLCATHGTEAFARRNADAQSAPKV